MVQPTGSAASSPPPSISPRPSARFWFSHTWLALLALCLISGPLFFWHLGSYGFFDPDEGRYAEIPREMLASGDFVTPTLNGVLYFEKPPLFYWSVAAFMHFWGPNEAAARMTSALCALVCLLVTYCLGRRMFGARAGFIAAIILATSELWMLLARQTVIDMQFSVLLFIALACFWFGHLETGRKRHLYFAGFWVSQALAVLDKGIVTQVLLGFSIIIYLTSCRQWGAVKHMGWWYGVPILLLITAPWFIVVAEHNPDFNHFFWYGQHVARFLGKGANREHAYGPLFFPIWIPLAFLPWTFFVPGAFIHGMRKLRELRTPASHPVVFLLAYAGFVTLFFSVSTSKLITYILPTFPAMALVMGCYFDGLIVNGREGRGRANTFALYILAALLWLGGGAIMVLGPHKADPADGLGPLAIMTIGGVLVLWALAIAVTVYRQKLFPLISVVAAGNGIFFCALLLFLPTVAGNRVTKPLIEYIRPGLAQGGSLITYDCGFLPSSIFYGDVRSTLFGESGELTFGKDHLSPADRDRWFPENNAALRTRFQSKAPVYCLVNNHSQAQEVLAKVGPVAQEIVWSHRRSILGNAAAARLTPPIRQLTIEED